MFKSSPIRTVMLAGLIVCLIFILLPGPAEADTSGLHVIVSASPATILAGGDTAQITAQLYDGTTPLATPGLEFAFVSDNSNVASLPATRRVTTGGSGVAGITLTSGSQSGTVNVNAFLMYNGTGYSDAIQVSVVGWGTISGMVTDQEINGVGGAAVKLWSGHFDGSGNWVDSGLYSSPKNPQSSVSDPNIAAVGTYTFDRIPIGDYKITAEKDGHLDYVMAHLTVGTITANIIMQGFVLPFQADFTASATSGTAPLAVTFSDKSVTPYMNYNEYQWNFGDGSANATTQNAAHTYGTPGTYTAMLTVTLGSKSSAASRQITVAAADQGASQSSSPTPSPSATPSPRPTPTATATPTVTPTPTPGPTVKPTLTATPTVVPNEHSTATPVPGFSAWMGFVAIGAGAVIAVARRQL